MKGLMGRRTASDMPGLDIAEQKSWQSFLAAALRLYAALNRRLMEAHQLSLADVRLLHILNASHDGSARMGDLAGTLTSPPSRVTRQIRRLEERELVRRATSPDDRRGVVATVTDSGRTLVKQAMVTYAHEVRTSFFARLSRSQIAAMEQKCRGLSVGVKASESSAKLGRSRLGG
ncbi:MAG: MarR family winged helix-turn-helix transcriptional regulator [Mycobacterium sp.]